MWRLAFCKSSPPLEACFPHNFIRIFFFSAWPGGFGAEGINGAFFFDKGAQGAAGGGAGPGVEGIEGIADPRNAFGKGGDEELPDGVGLGGRDADCAGKTPGLDDYAHD
jgi:hypothetical protein